MDILVDNLFINPSSAPQGIPGYLIRSTARANVEDLQDIQRDESKPTINTVIDLLYANSKKNTQNSNDLGVVIAIHGYNTGSADIDLNKVPKSDDEIQDGVWKNWYQKVCTYINNDPVISRKSDSLVFLGYRWPSETIMGKNFITSLSALPFLLKSLLWGSLIFLLISLFLFFWLSSPLFIFPVILGTFGVSIVLSLLILRVIVYFRDSYRATNYGVNDLVELIRQMDEGLLQRRMMDEQRHGNDAIDDEQLLAKAQDYWIQHPIKLSLIGHSMGGHVTTQAIRILSDVFDPNSIGNINNEKADKNPSSRIGRVFCLGRLLLVSPDIPLLTITSGRSNFLRSSLRRFDEAYLFSNEGDLALRVASTAANYFSFPALSRMQGYRLGNVTVRPKDYQSSKAKKVRGRSQSQYGIVNWKDKELCKPLLEMSSLLKYLEVSVLNQTQNQGLDPANQEKQQRQTVGEMVATPIKDHESISDLFTYFDCTEYKDLTDYPQTLKQEHYIMTLDKQSSPLSFWEYLQLGRAYIDYSSGKPFTRNARDVHGGYFWGKFSQQLIYRLAFVGFQEFLDSFDSLSPLETATDTLSSNRPSLSPDQAKRQMALDKLSSILELRQIQTVLSPERYLVDVLGEDRKEVRGKILRLVSR